MLAVISKHFALTTDRLFALNAKVIERDVVFFTSEIIFFLLLYDFLDYRFHLVDESLAVGHGFDVFDVFSTMGTFRFDD
jgi:hypothetical protein